MAEYIETTLETRSIDCSVMTEAEFCKLMMEDIVSANAKYSKEANEYLIERSTAALANYAKSKMAAAKNYATVKWKTESRRAKYYAEVEAEIAEFTAYTEKNLEKLNETISFFDLNVFPSKIGISAVCTLHAPDATAEEVTACFRAIKDSKYFKNANGWKLVYTHSDSSPLSSFRPEIKMVLDEKLQAEYDAEVEALNKSIDKFYNN